MGNEAFDKWWTNQCLKMAIGGRPYLAKSVCPGDQKVAFEAGRRAGLEEAAEIADNWRGSDGISCSHRLDIAETIRQRIGGK